MENAKGGEARQGGRGANLDSLRWDKGGKGESIGTACHQKFGRGRGRERNSGFSREKDARKAKHDENARTKVRKGEAVEGIGDASYGQAPGSAGT